MLNSDEKISGVHCTYYLLLLQLHICSSTYVFAIWLDTLIFRYVRVKIVLDDKTIMVD